MIVTPRTILANHTLLEPNSEVIAWAKMFSGSGWKQRGSLPLWDLPGMASSPGKGDSPSHGQVPVLAASPLPVCLYLVLSPSWFSCSVASLWD